MKKEKNAVHRRLLKKYDGLKYGWLRDIRKFLLLLAVLFILFHNVAGFSFVKGTSMEPTLREGDLVLYTRINSRYRRGDIVSVRTPSGEYYVKRIIAMEGDKIDIREGSVYVNDSLLAEPYTDGETSPAENSAVRYPCVLSKGQIFILGDNRPESMDSRDFGVVGIRQIRGKIRFRAGRFFLKKV